MPTKDELATEWNHIARNWIDRIRTRGDVSREFLLDEWMLNAVGDVRGLRVIDLGCGEGRFCRMLAERGADVTGIDLCSPMIEAAIEKCSLAAAKANSWAQNGAEHYIVADMENLADFANESFDLALSYITLVDVHDLAAAVREACRILKPGGRFIIVNLSPMVTAGNAWIRDAAGEKTSYYLDNYFDESPRSFVMCGGSINNAHRTLTTYISTFLGAGFTLENLAEPYPSKRQLEQCRKTPTTCASRCSSFTNCGNRLLLTDWLAPHRQSRGMPEPFAPAVAVHLFHLRHHVRH